MKLVNPVRLLGATPESRTKLRDSSDPPKAEMVSGTTFPLTVPTLSRAIRATSIFLPIGAAHGPDQTEGENNKVGAAHFYSLSVSHGTRMRAPNPFPAVNICYEL